MSLIKEIENLPQHANLYHVLSNWDEFNIFTVKLDGHINKSICLATDLLLVNKLYITELSYYSCGCGHISIIHSICDKCNSPMNKNEDVYKFFAEPELFSCCLVDTFQKLSNGTSYQYRIKKLDKPLLSDKANQVYTEIHAHAHAWETDRFGFYSKCNIAKNVKYDCIVENVNFQHARIIPTRNRTAIERSMVLNREQCNIPFRSKYILLFREFLYTAKIAHCDNWCELYRLGVHIDDFELIDYCRDRIMKSDNITALRELGLL